MGKRLAVSAVCMLCALSLIFGQVAFATESRTDVHYSFPFFTSAQAAFYTNDSTGDHFLETIQYTNPTDGSHRTLLTSAEFPISNSNGIAQINIDLRLGQNAPPSNPSYWLDYYTLQPGYFTVTWMLQYVSSVPSVIRAETVIPSSSGPIFLQSSSIKFQQQSNRWVSVAATFFVPQVITGDTLRFYIRLTNKPLSHVSFFTSVGNYFYLPEIPANTRGVTPLEESTFHIVNAVNTVSSNVGYQIQQQTTTVDNNLQGAVNNQLTGTISQGMAGLDQQNTFEEQQVAAIQQGTNAIGLNNITIPSTVMASMVWITGLFGDSWDGLGDYQNMFLIPLALGILVLILGRGITAITGFSVRRSRSPPSRR